jgi:hypothetical protein
MERNVVQIIWASYDILSYSSFSANQLCEPANIQGVL